DVGRAPGRLRKIEPGANLAAQLPAAAGQVSGGLPMKQVRRFLRRWLVRAALNLALLTGLFFAAAALERAVAPWWPEIPPWRVVSAAVIWAGAALLAVPPLLTAANRLKAAAILFAESAIPATTPRQT